MAGERVLYHTIYQIIIICNEGAMVVPPIKRRRAFYFKISRQNDEHIMNTIAKNFMPIFKLSEPNTIGVNFFPSLKGDNSFGADVEKAFLY